MAKFMISRSAKETFYKLAGPHKRVNAFFYKCFRQPKNDKQVRVHLGPGQKKYMSWRINIDANMFTSKCVVWADLRYSLPFYYSTIDAIYSHHITEHHPNLAAHFKYVYHCLKHGATYHDGGCGGVSSNKKFVERHNSWFDDWPNNRNSIGGRLENLLFLQM